jgi:hypothetical protein
MKTNHTPAQPVADEPGEPLIGVPDLIFTAAGSFDETAALKELVLEVFTTYFKSDLFAHRSEVDKCRPVNLLSDINTIIDDAYRAVNAPFPLSLSEPRN